MENTHFEYRPILSNETLDEMVDADGQPDAKAITNFYQNFLESRNRRTNLLPSGRWPR